MPIKKSLLSAAILLTLFTSSCDWEREDDVFCNQVFMFVAIEIKGFQPDSFHTVWIRKNQIINHNEFIEGRDDKLYPVLTDLHQKELENKIEDFAFRAFKDGKLVINELYKISADRCHIFKVEGKSSITF
jgi:hypothetical protein